LEEGRAGACASALESEVEEFQAELKKSLQEAMSELGDLDMARIRKLL